MNRKLSRVKTAMEAALASVRGIRQARGAIRAEKMLTREEVERLIQRLSARGRLLVGFLYATEVPRLWNDRDTPL